MRWAGNEARISGEKCFYSLTEKPRCILLEEIGRAEQLNIKTNFMTLCTVFFRLMIGWYEGEILKKTAIKLWVQEKAEGKS